MIATVIAPRRGAAKKELPTRRELRRRLKALGWSLRHAAEQAEPPIHPSYAYRMFSGEYWPAPVVYPRLVAAVEAGERERAKSA